MKIAITLLVVFALSAFVQNAVAIDKKALLATHNAERALVGASALTWSNSLAAYAQEWANNLSSKGCKLQHRSKRSVNGQTVGENLAMWLNGNSRCNGALTSKNDAYGVCLWNEEKDHYKLGKVCSGSGAGCAVCTKKPCGHYTQVVWANSNQVGCGIASCGAKKVLVCNYASAGNYFNQSPFASKYSAAFKKQANYAAALKSQGVTPAAPSTPTPTPTPTPTTGDVSVSNNVRIESLNAGCRLTNMAKTGTSQKLHVKVKCGNKMHGVSLYEEAFIRSLNNPAYVPDYFSKVVLPECTEKCQLCSASARGFGPWC